MPDNALNITPIILGSDYNAYGMVRSFYEVIHRPIDIYCSFVLAPCKYSKIINYNVVDNFETDPTWINTMRNLRDAYKTHKEPVVLIACGDGYSKLITKHRHELEDTFICFPSMNADLMESLEHK